MKGLMAGGRRAQFVRAHQALSSFALPTSSQRLEDRVGPGGLPSIIGTGRSKRWYDVASRTSAYLEDRHMGSRSFAWTILFSAFAIGIRVDVRAADDLLDEKPQARIAPSHGYAEAIELARGKARAVLCPEAGGRVLEFSVGGKQALWFDEQERKRQPGQAPPLSAGRFDFGPELVTPAHPKIWSGQWNAAITGDSSARLTSQRDEASGVQLVRDFELADAGALVCQQTITNISQQTREVCHWGRSFSPGGGLCLVPLAGHSRFPGKYAMYEDSAIINVRNTDQRIRERDGFLEILGPPRKPKLGFDSYAGWLAYLMPGDRLFVKRFQTFPDRVYNEAAGLTLSVWYPEGERIELEPIGPRERLAPGESASFTETWYLLSHPFPQPGRSIDLPKLREQVTQQTQAG
jgi:hypothetical protein